MNEKTIQDVTEALVRAKFPQILSKYQNKPLKFQFQFPQNMEDKPEIRLFLYVGGIQIRYTLLFPLTLDTVRMANIEKIR